jgi:branched-chain amino acid transport system ATP-binding protein
LAIQKDPQVIRAYLGEEGNSGEPSPPPGPGQAGENRAFVHAEALLEVRNLNVHYGPIHAVQNASLRVGVGECVALIGGNGAGKSSVLRALSGLVRASSGEILLGGKNISSLRPHQVARMGLVQAPEGRGIFPNLTVRENLDLGLSLRRTAQDRALDEARCFELFPILRDRLDQFAGTLSGGEQQMLALARAILARPALLLLDEPSLGLAPQVVTQIFKALREINQGGVGMLLVEQNAVMALGLCSRGYVLENGRLIASGSSGGLKADPILRGAYLGV